VVGDAADEAVAERGADLAVPLGGWVNNAALDAGATRVKERSSVARPRCNGSSRREPVTRS
jgi:hypothetical protein